MTATSAGAVDSGATCCASTSAEVLSEVAAQERVQVLKALADPNRLRLLSIVKNGPVDGTCVCDLTEPLQLGQPTVSHHLKILVDAGLLVREKRGTWAYYTLIFEALENAAALIVDL